MCSHSDQTRMPFGDDADIRGAATGSELRKAGQDRVRILLGDGDDHAAFAGEVERVEPQNVADGEDIGVPGQIVLADFDPDVRPFGPFAQDGSRPAARAVPHAAEPVDVEKGPCGLPERRAVARESRNVEVEALRGDRSAVTSVRAREDEMVAGARSLGGGKDEKHHLGCLGGYWWHHRVTPDGTRTNTGHWKSGFYRIARATGMPVTLGYASGASVEIVRGLKEGDILLDPAGRYTFQPVFADKDGA